MNVIEDKTYDTLISVKDKLVLIKMGAEWCQPCRVQSPIIEQFATENEDILVFSCDIDENHEISKKFKVRGVPSLIFLKNGEVVHTKVGLTPLTELNDIVAKLK